MRQCCSLFALLALIAGMLGSAVALADTTPVPTGLAVADFSFLDTTGEPTDQTAAHQRRLQDFMAALRRDLTADGRFRLVLATGSDEAPEALMQAAKDAGAKFLVIGGIHKLSTLVQWAQVDAIDVAADRSVLSKLFTFRGDSDEAWIRAESFVSRDLRAAFGEGGTTAVATPPAELPPVKLAVFAFEYEDFSPAATSSGATASDLVNLDKATDMVRRLFAKSGRYNLVGVDATDAPAVKARSLRDCNGCDAALALKLGAEQSFVGVVRRISRTEYTVRFQIRDAKTGAVVADAFSGLRMGADYSWDRGARRLLLDQYLEKKQP